MLFIPKDGRGANGKVQLKAVSTINQSEFSFSALDEDTSLLYHKIWVRLPESVQPGEYRYSLTDEIGELSSGLLVIGDLQNPIEYINETEYEQYEE